MPFAPFGHQARTVDFAAVARSQLKIEQYLVGRHARIRPNLAALWFPCKRAEPIPAAHGPHTGSREILQPVIHPRMGLMAVFARIVTGEEVQQPRIGLGLVLGFPLCQDRCRLLQGDFVSL